MPSFHGALGNFDREPDRSLHWKATGESAWAPYGWVPHTGVIGFFSDTLRFLGTAGVAPLSHPKTGLSGNQFKEVGSFPPTAIPDQDVHLGTLVGAV